jgi:hypothetical protein
LRLCGEQINWGGRYKLNQLSSFSFHQPTGLLTFFGFKRLPVIFSTSSLNQSFPNAIPLLPTALFPSSRPPSTCALNNARYRFNLVSRRFANPWYFG